LYRTTIVDALRRIAKGFTRTLIEYNAGEILGAANIETKGITAGEPEATELVRDAPPDRNKAITTISSVIAGGTIAAGISAVATVIAGILWWDSFFPDNDPVERGFLLFFCVVLAAFVAAVHGAAIGALIVPGRHRLRIIGAIAFGLILGLGLRLAVGPPKAEWGTTICIVALVTVCAAVGVFAPENL
jgi:hypothetical protein